MLNHKPISFFIACLVLSLLIGCAPGRINSGGSGAATSQTGELKCFRLVEWETVLSVPEKGSVVSEGCGNVRPGYSWFPAVSTFAGDEYWLNISRDDPDVSMTQSSYVFGYYLLWQNDISAGEVRPYAACVVGTSSTGCAQVSSLNNCPLHQSDGSLCGLIDLGNPPVE